MHGRLTLALFKDPRESLVADVRVSRLHGS